MSHPGAGPRGLLSSRGDFPGAGTISRGKGESIVRACHKRSGTPSKRDRRRWPRRRATYLIDGPGAGLWWCDRDQRWVLPDIEGDSWYECGLATGAVVRGLERARAVVRRLVRIAPPESDIGMLDLDDRRYEWKYVGRRTRQA